MVDPDYGAPNLVADDSHDSETTGTSAVLARYERGLEKGQKEAWGQFALKDLFYCMTFIILIVYGVGLMFELDRVKEQAAADIISARNHTDESLLLYPTRIEVIRMQNQDNFDHARHLGSIQLELRQLETLVHEFIQLFNLALRKFAGPSAETRDFET